MNNWFQSYTFLGLPIEQWLYACVISVVAYHILLRVWHLSIKKMTDIAKHTSTNIDDIAVEVLQSTRRLSLALCALLVGIHLLDFPEKWETRLDHLLIVVIGIQIAVWLNKGITIWSRDRLVQTEGPIPNAVITSVLSWILKVLIWTVLMLTILANVGVNITALVASMGIGGVAVALAVQNILSDLFASLAIGLDKPFVIGDAVAFGDVAGTIERVGLKTTHIRSVNGEQIICSNTELLKNIIHNYKRMPERRVAFKFGVNYATDVESIARIPQIVRSAIESCDKTRFDRAHFKELGTSSLEFEVVYFIVNSDFNLYMDIQQTVNLHLMKEFQANNVKFAFPTMTLDLPRTVSEAKSADDSQQRRFQGAIIK